MFGLLKKSDFDAEMIFLKSQMNSNANETNNIQNNSFELLKQLIKIQEETRQQLNIIEKLIYTQQSNQIQSKSVVEFNNKIDFVGLTDFLSNLYKNKTCLVGNPNRILEKSLEREIEKYLCQQQNISSSPKRIYPNFNLNYSPEADLLLIDTFQQIHSIVEIKRWDSALNPNDYNCGARISQDRSLHYIALNKLALSKNINPNIKHYYISVYENNDIFKKGYIAAKKQSNSAGYGPLAIKQNSANFIDFNEIQKEFSDVNYQMLNFNNFANVLENSFLKMYNANLNFDFEYVDINNLMQNNYNPFLSKKCCVILDKQINNTNLNQQQINNYSEIQLAQLPANWRIRIIEVL